MRYTSRKVSETLYRLSTGRDTIGWIRKQGDARWLVSSTHGAGEGWTAQDAFRDFMRNRNNTIAKRAGFKSARDMVEAQNAQVRKEVADWNAAVGDILPMRIRRRRGIIV